jgi:hypothetical protein
MGAGLLSTINLYHYGTELAASTPVLLSTHHPMTGSLSPP